MNHPENNDRYKGLNVQKGIEQPPILNPYRRKAVRKKEYSVREYVDGILQGNRVLLSQAVTLVESSRFDHQVIAQQIIEKCLPHAGKSVRIGITGVPGAGKSTSIETFGMQLIRSGKKLAVLAIDPSSERSKGSILGDKTRMEELAVQENAFIRPSPAAGSLGGVARKTRETIVLCEAAGFDTIFVETVGVGQSETAVHSMVDFFLLIQITGGGDELQGIKRGIMEMADGIVINKADGDNIDKAKVTQTQYRNALHLFPMPESGWKPEVLPYSGRTGMNVPEVLDMVFRYIDFTKNNGFFQHNRTQQARYWMYESINEQLRNRFYHDPEMRRFLDLKEKQVLNDEISSFAAAHAALERYYEKNGKSDDKNGKSDKKNDRT
jgi:LAO/AO transport system kinase